MIELYRKLPVEIEAILWDGSTDAIMEIENWIGDGCQADFTKSKKEPTCIIPSSKGDYLANFGDYIIKGVKGECYPCKPDIFKMIYEKVS